MNYNLKELLNKLGVDYIEVTHFGDESGKRLDYILEYANNVIEKLNGVKIGDSWVISMDEGTILDLQESLYGLSSFCIGGGCKKYSYIYLNQA